MQSSFGERLTLALKALSMSRGRLAAELQVDKSLVGRWASGAVHPAAHNLERLTRLLAEKHPGLTLLDWEREPADFAAFFGVDPVSVTQPRQPGVPLPPETLDAAYASTSQRGEAYEGLWRATHPAVIAPGRFFHEHGMIRRGVGACCGSNWVARTFGMSGRSCRSRGRSSSSPRTPSGICPAS